MNITQETLITSLENIIQNSESPLQKAVAQEILDNTSTDEDVKRYFSDLLQHGCISGMVGSLIYYCDTYRFFDEHYNEIEQLRLGYEESTGMQLIIKNDLKNDLAWFAFEEVAYQLANSIGVIE